MDDLVGAAELGELVLDGVETVGAGGDHLPHLRGIHRLDVGLRLGLVQVLVADPPRRVAVAGLRPAEDRKVDAGHSWGQAPPAAQAQIWASLSGSPVSFCDCWWARRCSGGAWRSVLERFSRAWTMINLGLRGLPGRKAGHCSWQRPHSVQE